jgi:hypothetical protein
MRKVIIIINDDRRRIWKARSWPTLRFPSSIRLMILKKAVIASGRTDNVLKKI